MRIKWIIRLSLLKKGSDVKDLINKMEKPIKINLILRCEYYKYNLKEKVTRECFFNSGIQIITEASDLDMIYDRIRERIIEQADNYQNRGSGWIFAKIVDLTIHIDKYNPIAAKSFIQLPDKIKKKEAVVNLENDDNLCFKWSVTRALCTV